MQKFEFFKYKLLFTRFYLIKIFSTCVNKLLTQIFRTTKWLGHGNPATTKKYYIDVLSDFEKEQANKINKIFKIYIKI